MHMDIESQKHKTNHSNTKFLDNLSNRLNIFIKIILQFLERKFVGLKLCQNLCIYGVCFLNFL